MARYVSTKTASGASAGGSAGLSSVDVCNLICNLSTQSPADSPSPLIMPGFGCWQMICNCPCWTECYGCCVIWCIDTSKYKAFKVHPPPRKPYKRKELESLATIDKDMSKEEIIKIIQSTYYPGQPAPFIELHGYKFEYNPDR